LRVQGAAAGSSQYGNNALKCPARRQPPPVRFYVGRKGESHPAPRAMIGLAPSLNGSASAPLSIAFASTSDPFYQGMVLSGHDLWCVNPIPEPGDAGAARIWCSLALFLRRQDALVWAPSSASAGLSTKCAILVLKIRGHRVECYERRFSPTRTLYPGGFGGHAGNSGEASLDRTAGGHGSLASWRATAARPGQSQVKAHRNQLFKLTSSNWSGLRHYAMISAGITPRQAADGGETEGVCPFRSARLTDDDLSFLYRRSSRPPSLQLPSTRYLEW